MINPFLLWFLPLAALPVLLHLLNLYRLHEVELPTYRFLMEGYIQQRRRIRLVEWLLMLLRTAMVLMVIWALSRPVVERFGGLFGGRGRDVVFVVDAGMTTGLVVEGTSALHRIREAVRAAASRLQPADFVTLVRAGMEPRVLFRAALGDGRRFMAELETLEPDPGPADLAAGLAEATAGPPRGPRTVWLVSDCERRGWRRLQEQAPAARVPEDAQLVVVDVAAMAADVRNVAILGDPPRSQRPVVGLPVELTIRVEASGFDTPVETKATVLLDDEVVAQVTIVVPPGRPTTHTLAVVPPRPGALRGRVEIPADAFPEDDALLFVLNVEPRVGVLVIAPPGLEPIFDPALFLRAALDSPRETAAAVREDARPAAPGQPPAARGDAEIARSLDVTVARGDAVDEKRLREADVVFLVDQRLDGTRLKWLRERVEAGAGLVAVAGSHKHGADDLKALFSVDGRQPEALPLGFGKAEGDVDDETQARSLAAVDFSHPIFAAFRPDGAAADPSAEPSAFDTLRVFRHQPLELRPQPAAEGDLSRRRPPAVVLARLDDGSAVMAEAPLGRGRVIVSGLPVTPDWSNLPVHPAFVPIMLRMVQHVRPELPAVAVESVHPYEPAPIRLNDAWRRAVVQAIGPAGGRRAIETVAGDDGVTGALDDTRAVGFYEFDVEPPAGVTAPPLRLGLAVNRDVETAAFEHVSATEVAGAFAPHPVMHLAGTAEDPTLHAQLTGRREIWRWLIGGLFGLFALEFLLSTLRPPTPVGAGGAPQSWSGRINDWLARAVGNTGDTASA